MNLISQSLPNWVRIRSPRLEPIGSGSKNGVVLQSHDPSDRRRDPVWILRRIGIECTLPSLHKQGLPMALELHFAHRTPAAWDDVRTDAQERAWVERIRAGDPAAFEALYRAYWERLYAFAFRYLRSKEDAEEIVQEVFFR